jgi:hypothetical protein
MILSTSPHLIIVPAIIIHQTLLRYKYRSVMPTFLQDLCRYLGNLNKIKRIHSFHDRDPARHVMLTSNKLMICAVMLRFFIDVLRQVTKSRASAWHCTTYGPCRIYSVIKRQRPSCKAKILRELEVIYNINTRFDELGITSVK